MQIDVVIVNYRSAGALAVSLPVLLRFAGDQAQVIVSDNSPGDGAAEQVLALVPAANVITNSGNLGFAAAVNRAVRASHADLVLLANPDICDIDGSLAQVVQRFEEDPRLAAVGVVLVDEHGLIQQGWNSCPTPWDVLFFSTPLWRLAHRGKESIGAGRGHGGRRVPALCGAFLFLRRDALLDVGPFDERFFLYYEETDWLVRAARREWRSLVATEVRVVHQACSSDGGSVGVDREQLLLQSQQRYLRKHFGIAAERLVWLGLLAAGCVRLVGAALRRPTSPHVVRQECARLRVLASLRTRHPD